MDDIYVFVHPRVTEGASRPRRERAVGDPRGAPRASAEPRVLAVGRRRPRIGRELLDAAATLAQLEGRSGRDFPLCGYLHEQT